MLLCDIFVNNRGIHRIRNICKYLSHIHKFPALYQPKIAKETV